VITDEQIRALLAQSANCADYGTCDECLVALGEHVSWLSAEYRAQSRARCAAIWNARKEGK